MNRRRFFSLLCAAPVAAVVASRSSLASGGIVEAPKQMLIGERVHIQHVNIHSLGEEGLRRIGAAIAKGVRQGREHIVRRTILNS